MRAVLSIFVLVAALSISATAPAHKRMLEQAIATLDQQLSHMKAGSKDPA